VAEIHLRRTDAGDWGVQSASSDALRVRHPEPLAAVNPPFSSAFTASRGRDAAIVLYDARSGKALGRWSERIDPDTDWFANANFSRGAKPFQGFMLLTVRDEKGELTALVVLPLTIGTA